MADTVFTKTFAVIDVGVEVASVEIDVTGAQNSLAEAQADYIAEVEFDIDTLNPTTIVALDAIGLSDSSNSTTLTIMFSEVPIGFDAGNDLTVTGGVLSAGAFDASGKPDDRIARL